MHTTTDYLNPGLPAGLRIVRMPVVEATDESLAGYGRLVDRADPALVEVVRWPAAGWRPVDLDSGNEGGTTEGIFHSSWQGDILFGSNEAVGGNYLLGYACLPEQASIDHDRAPQSVLLWHANYHPDGGQLFFPLDGRPFVVPLALPGDDVRPESFVSFYFRGEKGLCIHPNIWHEGVFTCEGTQRFHDIQGAVHARVSVKFAEEFQCLVEAPLHLPDR